jgi:hypothetical protein
MSTITAAAVNMTMSMSMTITTNTNITTMTTAKSSPHTDGCWSRAPGTTRPWR